VERGRRVRFLEAGNERRSRPRRNGVGCEGALGRFSQKTQRGEVAASLVGPPGVVAMEPAIAAGLHDPFTKECTQPFLPRDHIRKMLTAMEYYYFSIT
jgi:hypothetical protein